MQYDKKGGHSTFVIHRPSELPFGVRWISRTEDEDTLRNALWRSDGTMDQLYLALRLAVSEELTPDAPLVLDDAFVRFDDTRLTQAMDILKESGEHKQVILFTCQGRERKFV